MKRSLINQVIDKALVFFKQRQFPLPPFAYWSFNQWLTQRAVASEIIITRLGWDVTDFGLGNFNDFGRIIFTLRNGNIHNPNYPKKYCQKVMYLKEGQKSPIHFHKSKMEDIYNQGGGNILMRLWKILPDKKLSTANIKINIDGAKRIIKGGETLRLQPGESICVIPETYHQFWADVGSGPVLSTEISSVNDDVTDNFWYAKIRRFPSIDEDEPRRYILCSEYTNLFQDTFNLL